MQFPEKNRRVFLSFKTDPEMKGKTKINRNTKYLMKTYSANLYDSKKEEVNHFLDLGLKAFLKANNTEQDLNGNKYDQYIDYCIQAAVKAYQDHDKDYSLPGSRDFVWALKTRNSELENIVAEGWSGPATELVKMAINNPNRSDELKRQLLRHDITEKLPQWMPIEEQYQDPAARYFESYLAAALTQEMYRNKDFVLWNSIRKISDKIFPWYANSDQGGDLKKYLAANDFVLAMDFHNEFFLKPFRSIKSAPSLMSAVDRKNKSIIPYDQFCNNRGRYVGQEDSKFSGPEYSGIMLPWQPRGALPDRPKLLLANYPVELYRPAFQSNYVNETTPTGSPFSWGLSGQTTVFLGGALNIEAALSSEEKEQYLLAVAIWLINLGWHSLDEVARVAYVYYDLLQKAEDKKLEAYLDDKKQGNLERLFSCAPEIGRFVDQAWQETINFVKQNINNPMGRVPAWLRRPDGKDLLNDDNVQDDTVEEMKAEHKNESDGELEGYANKIAAQALIQEGIYSNVKLHSIEKDGTILTTIILPDNTVLDNADRLYNRILSGIFLGNRLDLKLVVGKDETSFKGQAGRLSRMSV